MDSSQPFDGNRGDANEPTWTSKPHLFRLAVGVWTVLAILAVGRAAFVHLPRHRGSYSVFAEGARHWQAGQNLFERDDPNSLTVFRYCPLVAVMQAPLAWLPEDCGSAVMRFAGLALFIPGLLWWWGTIRKSEPQLKGQGALFFLLVAAMSNHSLMDVQLTVPTIGLLLITIAAAADERLTLAAAACTVAIAFKAYPVSLALCLALLFPRPFAWRLLAALAVGLALPFLFQNPGYVVRQYHDWLYFGLNSRYADDWFCDFMSLGLRCGAPMSRSTYQVLEVLAGLGVAACCLLLRRRGLARVPLLNASFGLSCAWMMAFGPATEAKTYIILAPAVAAALVFAWTRPQPAWYRVAVTVSFVLLSLSQFELLFPLDKPLERWATPPFAAVLFMAAVAVRGLGEGISHPTRPQIASLSRPPLAA